MFCQIHFKTGRQGYLRISQWPCWRFKSSEMLCINC